ncbi:hypothetical protein [Streptomyces armeniacus]|uniref:hypothetical protein n=1 Tax=Streptomyces armeniacus TaxID=83291 RepID=UPI001FE3378E|nr:hypothetical protein [Streptomyces armeniacus]
MAWEQQWAQLVEDASRDSGLKLASAGDEPGWASAPGGMRSDKKAWSTAATNVGSLKKGIDKGLGDLAEGQAGLGEGSVTGGQTQSGAAQRELYTSWKQYLGKVSGRCAVLQDRLEKAGNDHYKNDQATKRAFDGLNDRYEDTPAIGGQDGSRWP